ncbi:NAD(P)/FAD-dependent oxidoreductase [Nonomuraea endophytica]|uniref:Thioredoxin reductase n=1 Tax=Nonomuraea endophytica TaxID=714136 RepID=A0A7W8A1G0_9ACTN|nr:NAD(P)/FAD-dependent oxidoreductase [Nonomuraea endophytica]MBB5077812.1 thioredoxin reductase [Nonomuraea endophytica]
MSINDVVIVGGGPAGLAAALILGRAHRRVLLLDAGHGRNAPAEAVHNFLTRDGTPPAELRELARAELSAYPSVEIREETVTAVSPGFRVELSGGATAGARRLLLATGLSDALPGPPGVEALWGRSAFHCPYCHGWEVSGKAVAVVGAAPARVRLALQLSRFADVALCTDQEPLDPAARAKLLAHGVTVRDERIARLEAADARLERIVFEDGPPLPRQAVFVVNVARRNQTDLAARLGCATFADGCVEVNEFGQTSVRGVYAAGDLARRATVPVPLAAVIAAAAAGTVAGAALDQDLLSADFDLPAFAAPKG